MQYTYRPCGTCSRAIHLEVTDGLIQGIKFEGGCNGNLQGIAALAKGKTPAEVADALQGIRCGNKDTSCPDQLAQALRQLAESE